jgi:pilus assembly protein Flp/PilA
MQHLFFQEGFSPMLKYYIKTSEALKQLRTDVKGVVSFEYVIVAACVVGAVIAAFGTGTASGIGLALTTALGKITDAVNAIVVPSPV